MSTSIEGLSLVTVIALIRKEIAESAAASRPGKDGAQGVKGERGVKGDSGPAGRQGPKGNDGKQGKPGKDGSDGSDGACGEDGVGIEDIIQDGDGAIIVTMTDGEVYTLDMPLPGETQIHYKVGGGSSGGGESGSFEVTTDQVKTRSDIVFRDAKGRYKSTENIPELKNQLEVNRWFVEQLEAIEAGNGGVITEDAPSDNKNYGRKNGEWAYLSFDTKVGNRRLTNVATARLSTDQVLPEYTTEPYFALSNTDGTYSAPEVEEMANYVYLHQYNRIAFNGLESTMIQLEAGDHIEFSNLGSANQCLIMTITAADVQPVGDRFSGVFDFEINGHDWGDILRLKEGLQYTFHAVKGGAGSDLPEMTNDWTPNTLALRDDNGNSKFTQITVKNITFAQSSGASNTADTWFLSGGEQSTNGIKKNDAAGMRSSLSVYSKDEVDALSGGDSFFNDIGSNTIEYFGDQLWVTSLRDPFFIGAKIGSDSEFTGTVTANKFAGDGSDLTGTVSTKALAEAFGDIQAALSNEKTVAGLKKALTNSLGGLIETLEREQ